MSDFRINVTDQRPIHQPTTHAHIVAVGTGPNATTYDTVWTLAQVVYAIDVQGHRFYTVGPRSGQVALVETIPCGYCNTRLIRSAPDATTDNNLDSLPRKPLI